MALFSCSKSDNTSAPADPGYLKITEASSVNSLYDIQMYANDSLFVGYNIVYFKVREKSSGNALTNAGLTLLPVMDMGTFTHACPVEHPAPAANSYGYFQGAVLFSMPGTNTWTLDVHITAGNKTDSVHFAFPQISAKSPAAKIVVIDSLEQSPGTWKITKYPISLVIPEAWSVGMNPFEITIHRMDGYYSFPPVTDLTVGITPEMPSMGHGSPNNVDPVHVANGHYQGQVNFTMTGDWRIHLTIRQGNRLISDKSYFDIIF